MTRLREPKEPIRSWLHLWLDRCYCVTCDRHGLTQWHFKRGHQVTFP